MKIKTKTMKKGLLKQLTGKALLLASACLVFSSAAEAQVTTITVKDSRTGNVHWTNDKQYLLQGYVYAVNGTVLTIDSGVVIRGDKNTKGT